MFWCWWKGCKKTAVRETWPQLFLSGNDLLHSTSTLTESVSTFWRRNTATVKESKKLKVHRLIKWHRERAFNECRDGLWTFPKRGNKWTCSLIPAGLHNVMSSHHMTRAAWDYIRVDGPDSETEPCTQTDAWPGWPLNPTYPLRGVFREINSLATLPLDWIISSSLLLDHLTSTFDTHNLLFMVNYAFFPPPQGKAQLFLFRKWQMQGEITHESVSDENKRNDQISRTHSFAWG